MAPIRVQDVRLDYDNSQIYVSATLLDRSPPDGKFHTVIQLETVIGLRFRQRNPNPRANEFVNPRGGISRSASETDL